MCVYCIFHALFTHMYSQLINAHCSTYVLVDVWLMTENNVPDSAFRVFAERTEGRTKETKESFKRKRRKTGDEIKCRHLCE